MFTGDRGSLEGLHPDTGCLRHLNHNGAFKLSYGGTEVKHYTDIDPRVQGFVSGDSEGLVALTPGFEREIGRLCLEGLRVFSSRASYH